MSGMFITIEGVDGSGKSTHIRSLEKYLQAAGHDVTITREPGGSPGAEEIRRLIVEGEPGRWSPETETLLFKAARRDHLERLIRPSLAQGRIVLSDRFADSTRVYQGARDAALRRLVDLLHAEMIGIEPDLTIIIDADPDAILERLRERALFDSVSYLESRFERKGIEFQRSLQQGFRQLVEEFPERCVLVDGMRTEAEVFADIAQVVEKRLEVQRV